MRTNRSKWGTFYTQKKPLDDEKMVGFRMSERRYEALKKIASKRCIPIAELINEVLDNKLHLEEKAQQLFKDAAS